MQIRTLNIAENEKEIEINVAENTKIVVPENTKIKIIENLIGSCNIEYEIRKNTDVEIISLSINRNLDITKTYELDENAYLDIKEITINKGVNTNNTIINLNKKYATVEYKLIVIANNTSTNKFDVTANNNTANTKANIWQKSVVKNDSKTTFLTTGYIAKNAENAENFQESKILLLDEAALGNASPFLYINHHDVKAGHAASVSKVALEDLYYLQTRGINEKEAEKLLIKAFIAPLFDQIEEEKIKNEINKNL